ncbi:DUF6481 family protein [Granulibacter bethesdensis]|uniref:Uncharacterized protein n=2 Tax=Granulibacter bethesdensis TaxID=364410 RepID=Q0BVE9_GRABC|nr:DUF6481 family protein [Granulibacter bethesdensis]ABI61203.1 Hypothetical protein GbCGDNIH1_0305 [Granulibacter bethesdensis CGDNIH1]AHJ62066.1 Hypothetical protein GbCGDNIH3_0305 [Granulibacter bethesdensis]AHJ64692.1 Hypothetical protein GbCGDNIH4_0305 [Granulibacter bethesdensis CGDNIH4]AHJ67307.1 Hypothetical protein GbCGDNIH2_0305 [Granulibacter bethesdensis]APH50985.1 Hypothetical protein GbCGDNIH5_0305 [Granulibacter bethesdensis]
MSAFKFNAFNDRREAAAKAKAAMLDRFKSAPSLDDPDIKQKLEEQRIAYEAREARLAERKRLKAEEAARIAAEKAAAEKARIEEERAHEAAKAAAAVEEKARALALLAEQKAERDRRYAARKARTGRK